MLDQALACVANDLKARLKRALSATDDQVVLSGLVDSSDSAPTQTEEKIVLLLVAIDEEKNILAPAPARGGATVNLGTGQIYLNLHVMFAATHKHYPSALRALSELVGCLKAKSVYDRRNTPSMSPTLRQLNFNMEKLAYADLSNIWSFLGTNYLPSANYTIRMVALGQDQLRANPPAIETVQITN